MIGWALVALLIYVSLAVTWIAWIPTVLLLYWKIGRQIYLKGSKWRRVHFPFMRTYAHAAGLVEGFARQTGAAFDVRLAILKTLQGVYPRTPEEGLEAFMESRIIAGQSFYLRPEFARYLRQKNRKIGQVELDAALDRLAQKFAHPDNSIMVRLVVLGVIEKEHGTRAALDYLWALIKGQAN